MEITIEDISVSYLDKKRKINTVLKNYSLKIPNEKITAILGASGSGKTTLLNTIAGLLYPESGKIYFDKQEVTNLPSHKRNIGYVFQNSALYPYLTIKSNILFPLNKIKISKAQKLAKVVEISKTLHIDKLLDRKPSELSGGEARRVALARALVKSPNLLLLDEPFSALDLTNKMQAMEFLKKVKKQFNITIVFVTHDPYEANFLADNIVKLK